MFGSNVSNLAGLQRIVPIGLVFEHNLPQKPNWGRSVPQYFVMKFLQRKGGAFLAPVIVAKLQEFQFANGIKQKFRIERAADCFLTGGCW